MSAANEFTTYDGAVSPQRRCAANVARACVLLARPPFWPSRTWGVPLKRIAIRTAAVFAGLLFCIVVIDGPVIEAVSKLPRWIIWPFDEITEYGKSGWLLWPFGLLFLGMAALPARPSNVSQAVLAAAMVRVGFLFTAIGVPGLAVVIVKNMIGRARPLVTGSIDPYVFRPFFFNPEFASLPSGHTTTAFAALVAIGSLWPRARTALLIYAVAIMVSRVVVLAHHPSDVLAGALFGTVGALMVRRYFALRRLGFSVGADGSVHAFAEPSLKRIKLVARELLEP